MSNSITIDPQNTSPSVTVFGCGGCGINLVRQSNGYIDIRAKYRFLDTSYSNIREGEEIIKLKGEGAGLNRKQVVASVNQQLPNLKDEDLILSDINIVVFSLSGGSGSVIGPLLIREIKRRGKLAIALTVASHESETHTKNTLNTLKGLEKDTQDFNIYLPIMIFDNEISKELVTRTFSYKLERLIDILTLPTVEIDKNDRLNWIDVPKTLGIKSGLRVLQIETCNEMDDHAKKLLVSVEKDYILDSIIHIKAAHGSEVGLYLKARAIFNGEFAPTTHASAMMGIIGNNPDVFSKLISKIETLATQYKVQSSKHTSVFSSDDDTVDSDTGMIV